MNHTKFEQFLTKKLRQPLPGKTAHQKMMPVPIDSDFEIPDTTKPGGHPSSVLIPLFPSDGDLYVILTLRTESIKHAGQISFPGGRSEVGEPPVETALRESKEEIGIDETDVSIAGSLTPYYLYRTDNQITPFVGFMDQEPALQANPNEVEEIITVSLDELASGERLKQKRLDFDHASFDVPYWDIHRVPLWGATAMMMCELLEIYREFLETD